MKQDNFSYVINFDAIEKSNIVFLGDHPDARIAKLCQVTVAANHPSQRRYCFKDGYIKFVEISMVFDRCEQRLVPLSSKYWRSTNRTYLFSDTSIVRLIFQKQISISQIKLKLISIAEAEKVAAGELVFEEATGKRNRIYSNQVDAVVDEFLPQVSLRQLKDIVSLLGADTSDVRLAA